MLTKWTHVGCSQVGARATALRRPYALDGRAANGVVKIMSGQEDASSS